MLANLFYSTSDGRTLLHAMPLLLGALCVLAIAYRYYSAFLAAKVLALDDARPTPAHTLNDGQNYHPTNKWVLFGHHFAAISGAGPLIGPVLAIQYGYMPGLLVAGDRRLPGRGGAGHAGAGGVGAPRRQIAGRDRPHRTGTVGERRRLGGDPVHRRHRAGGAGVCRGEGAGRRGGDAAEGNADYAAGSGQKSSGIVITGPIGTHMRPLSSFPPTA